ncbi:type VI secretion system lipoprotein TssJ [Pseudomonas guariconensis]|uniref:type VI secretion system lipoprotein TssJ n=1 Tax=Pseudomonas TaxID=286 RepID=UPI002098653C|nr:MULTISPECIES: type VI secretion system lipoprotein TssJ [Pseudomonas]MCO7637534.1 type VI secretion system lipoprotein TssJ [Pseudomonas sp. S 311-6]MCO7513952.1 type VI secretion system lipoprotein TssJ [Pseudomonas putida]MCO7563962.1 type VI secretion system lipoprotein TssJ [Pseudomonas mosselii]MCO7604984.1 type VI secretion system lipoprotein TssJ [Pseudomonas guariconensis]MCO7615539.1 type VI secretion system lipoprotein TssJ [Pseudomonas guariconensis]
MSLTVFRVLLAATTLGLVLSGCGLIQRAADGGSSIAHGLFYKQVKVLHLDFSARAALNTDTTDMSALSVSTLVRVYQLKDRKTLDTADYQSLLSNGSSALAADLLDERQVLVKPEEGVQLNVPMSGDAQFVAVVALFRSPDTQKGNWRLVLARDELDPDRPRVIEMGDNMLNLVPMPKQDS